jgi:hypothetical protein
LIAVPVITQHYPALSVLTLDLNSLTTTPTFLTPDSIDFWNITSISITGGMAPLVKKHKRATSGEIPARRTSGITKGTYTSLLRKFLNATYSKFASQKALPLPPLPPLVRLLTQYTPIQDAVLIHLDNRDVLALSKTTRAFRDFFRLVERTQYNINDFLRHFVSPQAFRSMQAQHNVLIAGSAAWVFMARKSFSEVPCNQDYLNSMVVEKGVHGVALFRFLDLEGYQPQPPPTINSHTRTIRWGRAAQPGRPIRKIVTIETPTTPVLEHTGQALPMTCVANFISWDRAYSLFPYHVPIIDFRAWKAVGYDIGSLTVADQSPNFLPQPPKQVSKAFDESGIRGAGSFRSTLMESRPPHLIDYASLEVSISRKSANGPGNCYTVKAQVVKSLSLRYQYVFSDAQHEQ